MYKGLSFFQSRRKGKKGWMFLCFIFMVVIIWGIAIFVASKAVAASENSSLETIAETVTEAASESEMIRDSVNKITFEEVDRSSGVPLIAIDPGHGGEDDGCNWGGVEEKRINLNIAHYLKTKLEEMGYQVIMIRDGDTYIEKEQRVEKANHHQADIYVSIHQNAHEGVAAEGLETWYYGEDRSRDSKRLAQLVHQQTLQSTGALDRELRDDAEYHVTGNTNMPACLIETGFLSNPKEREKLEEKEYQEQIAHGIAEGIDLFFHPKTMYLTFDDGPSEKNTNTVLDTLKERNIKATFFLIAENVRKYPETAKRIVEEGHAIGIHCNSHAYHEIYQSVDSYIKDFEEAYDIILETTGVETRMYRFPGGSVNAYNQKVYQSIVQEMDAMGFVYYDWNASLEDSINEPQREELLANAKETAQGREKVILLAHDIVTETALCLDELLDQFPEYRMEVLTPDVEPIQFKQ